MFCKEAKETTLTCSKQVSSSNTPTVETTLVLRIVFCTIVEEALEHPWCFWYKVLKVGRKNFLSYAMNDQHNLPFDSSLWSNIKATILWVLESLTQSMKSKKGLKTWGTCCCMLAPSFFTLVCMSISSMFVKASIWRPYHMIMVDL